MSRLPRSASGSLATCRELALALVFLAVWILVPFRDVAMLRAVNVQDDVYTSDLLNDRLPCRAFVGESVRRGEPPFWTRGVYGGFPALAAIEVGALYPSNLVLFTLLRPYVAIAYAQLLPLLIAGLGTFLLARDFGRSLPAAFLAAGAFALSGVLVAHLRQLNLVDAAAWTPFLLLAIERLARGRPRAAAALALVWALELLAGHPQIAYFAALVAVPWSVARGWSGGDGGPSRAAATLGWVVLALALGTLAAAAQILPTIELATLSHRRGGFSFEQAAAFPAAAANLWTFFLPWIHGDPVSDTYHLSGIFWEQYGYVGLAPVLLAVLAAGDVRRDRRVALLALVVLVSYLLVLGRATPLFALVYRAVPGMRYFRFPTRFLVFVDLGLVLLAAFGLDALRARLPSERARSAAAVAILAVTALDLWTQQMRQVPRAPWSEWTSPIGTVAVLKDEQRRSSAPWRYYTLDSAEVHVETFHAAGGWRGGPEPWIRLRAMIQPSSNLLYGLESPDGYVNLAPRAVEALWGSDKQPGWFIPSGEAEGGVWRPKPELVTALRLFNVRYVLSAQPLACAALAPVTRSAEGVYVWRVDDPLPRAFVVGRVRRVTSEEDVRTVLRSADFDPWNEALIEDPAFRMPEGAAPSRSATIRSAANTALDVDVSLRRPGLLVVSETDYPGWEAAIDGEPAPIVRANAIMRAVVVPAGEHRVSFRFRSKTIAAGFILSLAGAALLVAWLVVPGDRGAFASRSR